MKELEMTGERLVTSFNNHFGKFEHLHRYALAREYVEGKNVLDIACGEGYGTNLLSQKAKMICGVDISNETITHAKEKYQKYNIEFKLGSAAKIPYDNNTFDVVTSFETIEHLVEQEEMFSEIKRVLKKDGILIMSSPEKNIYSQRDPNNKFHLKELTLDELLKLTNNNFKNAIVLKQLISVGSLIIPVKNSLSFFKTYDGDYYNLKESFDEFEFFNKPYFNIVICSDFQIENNSFSSFFSSYEVYDNLLREKDMEINNLSKKLQRINSNKIYKILRKIKKQFKL